MITIDTQSPLLRKGKFGTHLKSNPNGTFSFVGSIHKDLPAGSYPTEGDGMQAFRKWFLALPIEEATDYIAFLRPDAYQIIFDHGTEWIDHTGTRHEAAGVVKTLDWNKRTLTIQF